MSEQENEKQTPELDSNLLHLHNKAMLQFEKNVAKVGFNYNYLYNYPLEGEEFAVVKLTTEGTESEDLPYVIHYYFGRSICYDLRCTSALDKGISLFWCDTLRDIENHLNNRNNGKKINGLEA